jgi:hypothetical protein
MQRWLSPDRIDVQKGVKGEFHCLVCDHLLEVFDGSTDIAIRLTVQPQKIFE